MKARAARARLLVAVLPAALALVSVPGCLTVSHTVRSAPLGDPATPALRAEGVTTSTRDIAAGEESLEGESWARPTVTLDGLQREPIDDQIRPAVVFSVRLADPGPGRSVDVVDMMWSPVSAPRCMGGHPALDLLLHLQGPKIHAMADELQVQWERPIVVRGERVIAGRFDEDRSLMFEPSVVDVSLVEHQGGMERETCVRVPVTGPDVTYWNIKKWSFGARVGGRHGVAFTPANVITFGGSFGRWVGPVRLGLEGVFGGTPDGTAEENSGSTGDRVNMGGFAVEASGLAWRWRRWALGWSVAYEALWAGVHHLDPAGGPTLNRRASAGGPRVGVQLLRVSPTLMGVSRISPVSAAGLEVFVAAGQEWSGAAAGSPVTFGVALLAF